MSRMKRGIAYASLCAALVGSTALGAEWFVATGGDDANAGSRDAPFKTIQKAADVAQPGDTVQIRAGVYRETVRPSHAGEEGALITFSAYNGEKVVVSGADPVAGWTRHEGEIWKAACDWDTGPNGDGNTLFVNGELSFEARQGAEKDPLRLSNWGEIPKHQLKSDGFAARDLTGFGDDFWNGAKVRHHTHDWVIINSVIADYDSDEGKITFEKPIGVTSQKHVVGYYIFDTIKALDKPGEWYKDRDAGVLYFQPAPGVDPNTLDIEFKRRAYMFDLTGLDYVRVHGLVFRGAHIKTSADTDHNVYDGNQFYAYDKGNRGRFWLAGNDNIFRDNEVSHSWGAVASVNGEGNQIVNNHLHDIGYFGTTRVLGMGGRHHLVAYNTVSKIARSFLDGYPTRSEFCYNIFEDGGNLSWDTGFFDGDSGRGNGGGCIVHHNLFRNTNPLGIFCASYAGLNYVIHHNIIHDVAPKYFSIRTGQLQFSKFYHNTIIGAEPEGNSNAKGVAFEAAYNNNLQIAMNRFTSLGVDFRGNVNYSPSDFVDFAGKDFRLAPGSAAIDAGIRLPEVNDDFAGEAPDAGALELGQEMWKVGYDFENPPQPKFAWRAFPGTNIFDDNLFRRELEGWTFVGQPKRVSGNAWNSLGTGKSRSGGISLELNPGEGASKVFDGLKPNTSYTVASETRLLTQVVDMTKYASVSGEVGTGSHRGEKYVDGLSKGESLLYRAVDFGEPRQFDVLELTYSRPPTRAKELPEASLEVRVGGRNGKRVGVLEYNLEQRDSWYAAQLDLPPMGGKHDLYLTAKGPDAGIYRFVSLRLLKKNIEPDHKLTIGVRGFGGGGIVSKVGDPYWRHGYETLTFKTGPAATSAELFFQNDGWYDAYVDRLALFEKEAFAKNVATELETMPNGMLKMDLGAVVELYGLKLKADSALGGFRVSVWKDAPSGRSTPAWVRGYFQKESLAAGEALYIKPEENSADGETELKSVRGRYVVVSPLKKGAALALGDLEVLAFDDQDLVLSDADVSIAGDTWSAWFPQVINVGQLALFAAEGGIAGPLSLTVELLDRAESDGGKVVWAKSISREAGVRPGGLVRVTADELGEDGTTRLGSKLGRVVRVRVSGRDAAKLFSKVSIHNAVVVPPRSNVALSGVATQSADHYATHGRAALANNGIILPMGEFTTARAEGGKVWWQLELVKPTKLDQIVIFNREDSAERIGDFKVSVWDGDPTANGRRLWSREYSYRAGDIPAGGALSINRDELGSLRGARVIRIDPDGQNLLSLPEVQVWAPAR